MFTLLTLFHIEEIIFHNHLKETYFSNPSTKLSSKLLIDLNNILSTFDSSSYQDIFHAKVQM